MMQALGNTAIFEARGATDAERRNLRTVLDVFHGFARGDFTVLPSKMAPGGETWVLGFTPERLRPHAANPNFIAEAFRNGLSFTFRSLTVCGNSVVVEWNDEAITAKGKKYKNDGVSLFRFDEDGRVTSYREYVDPELFFAVL